MKNVSASGKRSIEFHEYISPTCRGRYAGQVYITREPRTIVAGLKHQLALVEAFEFGPVADADDGRGMEPFVDQLHQVFLTGGIER